MAIHIYFLCPNTFIDPHAYDSELVADIVAERLSGWVSEKNNATPQQIKKAREIAKKAKNAETARKAVESGGVKSQPSNADIRFWLDKNKGHYDYFKSFAEQIEDFKSGKFPKRDTIVLCGTTKVLQKIGLSSLPVVMDQEHVKRALFGDAKDNHFLGEKKLKNLPYLIADPIAIIGSATHPNDSIMVITKEKVNGHQLAVPVQIDVDGIANVEIIDSKPAASAQGRPNAIPHSTKLYDTDVTIFAERIYPSGTGSFKFSSHPIIRARPSCVYPSSIKSSGLTPAMKYLPFNSPAFIKSIGAIEIAPIGIPENCLIKFRIASSSIASRMSIAPGKIKLSYSSNSNSSIFFPGVLLVPLHFGWD